MHTFSTSPEYQSLHYFVKLNNRVLAKRQWNAVSVFL